MRLGSARASPRKETQKDRFVECLLKRNGEQFVII